MVVSIVLSTPKCVLFVCHHYNMTTHAVIIHGNRKKNNVQIGRMRKAVGSVEMTLLEVQIHQNKLQFLRHGALTNAQLSFFPFIIFYLTL